MVKPCAKLGVRGVPWFGPAMMTQLPSTVWWVVTTFCFDVVFASEFANLTSDVFTSSAFVDIGWAYFSLSGVWLACARSSLVTVGNKLRNVMWP